MNPIAFTLLSFLLSILAGFIGSILGLGGGIMIIPALTLLFHIDIRYAVGASIVSVIATSSGAAAAYVREHLANFRIAMFLELGTTSGALTGAMLAGFLAGRWLFIIFSIVLAWSALAMVRRSHPASHDVPADPLSDRLRLHGAYFDQATGASIPYRVTHARLALLLMYCAGMISGLLGIGSGSLKVVGMDLAMRLPIKVSTATSNFMIGVTAAASAGVYFARGDIDPFIAAPVAAGILVGAAFGSRLLPRLNRKIIRISFVLVLLGISLQMLYHGIFTP